MSQLDRLTKAMRIQSSYDKHGCEEKDFVSSLSDSQGPAKPVKGAKEAEKVVKQINEQYDRLMSELKRYKEAKCLIESQQETATVSQDESDY